LNLKKQVFLYSLETKDFYTEEENLINEKYFKALRIKSEFINKKENLYKKLNKKDISLEEQISYSNDLKFYDDIIKRANYIVNKFKNKLNDVIESFEGIRTLRDGSLKVNKEVGLFESSLTRKCAMKSNKLTEDMFIVRVFHYSILKSIIDNGFYHDNKLYIYFTSSAGQIRTKKIVCIKKELYLKYENTITCGLNVDLINSKGGVNTNKYQAYLALTNSASMEWKRFNIDRIVVVDDIETKVNTEVDYIDRNTFEITRQVMDVPIEHMDGCGIMLPSVSKSSFMFRMPWMKGLLTPFDFVKFIEETGASPIIKDIYGKRYNIIDDNINIILTKSQFKMWKFYDSWEDYKFKFKEYKCEASKLNIEDIGSKATINYQMLQTLTSMTEDEITKIAQESINDILSIGSDKNVMLKALGATKENKNPNYFQKSLLLYPELLSDSHSREVIKSKKRSMVNDARSGKVTVNGYYTFIIPDVYAFCEWLFLGEENPKGLLLNKEVHCKIHNQGEIDVLRAPHLYREHAIRYNKFNDELDKWFITKGIYTSVHDPISKILQFDK